MLFKVQSLLFLSILLLFRAWMYCNYHILQVLSDKSKLLIILEFTPKSLSYYVETFTVIRLLIRHTRFAGFASEIQHVFRWSNITSKRHAIPGPHFLPEQTRHLNNRSFSKYPTSLVQFSAPWPCRTIGNDGGANCEFIHRSSGYFINAWRLAG